MTMGKRVLSKTSQSTPGELQKVLHFEFGGSSLDEDVGDYNIHTEKETSKDTIPTQHIVR